MKLSKATSSRLMFCATLHWFARVRFRITLFIRCRFPRRILKSVRTSALLDTQKERHGHIQRGSLVQSDLITNGQLVLASHIVRP